MKFKDSDAGNGEALYNLNFFIKQLIYNINLNVYNKEVIYDKSDLDHLNFNKC